jgi:hypothetical protein
MPTYDFRDTKTDEIFEKFISISNKEKYLKDNPHIKQVYTKVPGIISGTNMSMNVDNHGFKEVLQKVGEGHPGSEVYRENVRQSGKEVKTRQVVEKHAKIQADKEIRRNKKK